jgi:hypothetical protein
MSKKDIRKLVRKLRRQGWVVAIARSGPWRLTSPSGERITCSMSPSDPHAYANVRSDARRLGADV